MRWAIKKVNTAEKEHRSAQQSNDINFLFAVFFNTSNTFYISGYDRPFYLFGFTRGVNVQSLSFNANNTDGLSVCNL